MESEIIKLIATTGDIGTWVLLFAIYKMDRRLIALETKINDN